METGSLTGLKQAVMPQTTDATKQVDLSNQPSIRFEPPALRANRAFRKFPKTPIPPTSSTSIRKCSSSSSGVTTSTSPKEAPLQPNEPPLQPSVPNSLRDAWETWLENVQGQLATTEELDIFGLWMAFATDVQQECSGSLGQGAFNSPTVDLDLATFDHGEPRRLKSPCETTWAKRQLKKVYWGRKLLHIMENFPRSPVLDFVLDL